MQLGQALTKKYLFINWIVPPIGHTLYHADHNNLPITKLITHHMFDNESLGFCFMHML